jgi:hypothetical protein
MDYTPGIFQIKMSYYDENKKEQVHTTLAKQLALYRRSARSPMTAPI